MPQSEDDILQITKIERDLLQGAEQFQLLNFVLEQEKKNGINFEYPSGDGTVKVVNCAYGAGYLKEVVVVKERSVVLQFSLMGLLYLILPLLFQFCDTLEVAWEIKTE